MAIKKKLTNQDDVFTGNSGDEFILGRGGDDIIKAGGGDDIINGGAGNDRMFGGAGDDRIIAKAGNDVAVGGKGVDTLVVNGNFADAVITEIVGGYQIVIGSQTITAKSIESVQFADGKVAVADLINEAPVVANAIADQAASEDAPFTFVVPVNSFTDANAGDTLTYAATLADGSALPAWLSFDAATRTFSGTPVNGDVGAISVKVTADDGTTTVSDTFDITIANTNDAPVVANAIADQAATEEAAFTFVVPANSFTDVDAGDTLTYAATLADGSALPAWLSFDAATRTFSGTPVNGDVGAISVKVTADDGTTTVSDTFDITTTAVNDAPVISGVADIQVENSVDPLFPTFAVSDEEGNFGNGTIVNISSDDILDGFEILNGATVTTAANVVLVNGLGVGIFTDNLGSMSITFNANATEANIETVIQAIAFQENGGSGTSAITLTLTDSAGATSTPVVIDALSLATLGAVSISNIAGDNAVSSINDGDVEADEGIDASVTYVASVGAGNVNDVNLTITLGGNSDPLDVLALPTTAPGVGEIANIAGNLIYNDGSNHNVGTVTQVGNVITVSLSDAFYSAAAGTWDTILALVIKSTTVDADGADGVREVTFTIDGVGSVSVTETATMVITDGGVLQLTADSDLVTLPAVIDGDTNATLGGVDPSGINVFNANAGTLTDEDNFSGGSTVNDILTAVLDTGSNEAPTIAAIETFNISSNGPATLNAANITNTNAMEMNISGADDVTVTNIGSTFATVDASTSTGAVTLSTTDGQSLDVITGTAATSVTANDSLALQAAISVNAAAANAALTLVGNADFTIEGNLDVAVDATATTDSLTIRSVTESLTVTAGQSALTIDNVAATKTATINAQAMPANTLLTASGAGNVTISGGTEFIGDIDVSGLSGTLTATLADAVDNAFAIELGSGAASTINGGGASDVITIDAAASVAADFDNDILTPDSNPDIFVTGAGQFVLNNVTANVDADLATTDVTINTLAGATLNVVAADTTDLMGAATLVTVDASGFDASPIDTLTIGSALDDFGGDVTVNNFGEGKIDASYLTGDLIVSTGAGSGGADSVEVTLGAGNTSVAIAAGGSGVDTATVDLNGYAGTVALSSGAGTANVTLNNVGSNTIDADDATVADDDFDGDLTVALMANAQATILAGTGSITVTGGDADGADLLDLDFDGVRGKITVNAAEMAGAETLTINDSAGGFNLDVEVTGLGNGTTVDLGGSVEAGSTANVSLATGTLLGGESVTVTLGSAETVSVTGTGAGSTVNINAAAADEDDFDGDIDVVSAATNASITLSGTSDFELTNVSANVNAGAVIGGEVTISGGAATNDLTIIGGTGIDTVTTGAGADTINTGDGADEIDAGAGADTINGGNGNDIITGGFGLDTLTGGAGLDRFVFALNDTGPDLVTADHITDFVINEDVIDLSAYGVIFADLTIAIGATSAVITIDALGDFDKIVLDGSFVGQTFTADQFLF